jgi:hypothetical protein
MDWGLGNGHGIAWHGMGRTAREMGTGTRMGIEMGNENGRMVAARLVNRQSVWGLVLISSCVFLMIDDVGSCGGGHFFVCVMVMCCRFVCCRIR